MIAIVLSCDRYHTVARHMIDRYCAIWPDHPFFFRVAHHETPFPEGPRVSTRKTPTEIRENVLSLLHGIGDEEWIYWCMDDKFPVAVNVPMVKRIHEWVESDLSASASGVLFCKGRGMVAHGSAGATPSFEHGGMLFHARGDYSHIWIHQYLRVKVLRHLFLAFPKVVEQAKKMDFLKRGVSKPGDHALYVTSRDLAVFGESVSRGLLNLRCRRSMIDMGIVIPQWFAGESSDEKGLIGDMGVVWRLRIAVDDLRRRARGASRAL